MFKRRAKNPDAVTTREIVGLYSFEQVTLARKAHAADRIGDVARRDMLLDQARIGMRDVILIVDRVRPIYSPEQVAAGRAAMLHLDIHDWDAAESLLDPVGLDVNDMALLQRLGYLDGALPAEEEPDEEPLPAAHVEPALSPQSSTGPAPAASGPVVGLPDGTDLTDPHIQQRVEARVRSAYGEHHVVAWPRYRDALDGVAPVVPIINARPGAPEEPVDLGPEAKPNDAMKVAVLGERAGLDLVEFDPYRRKAFFARLDEDQRAIRNRLAGILKCQPHEVELAVHRVHDERLGAERLDQVIVLRAPSSGTSPEKRKQQWTDLVHVLPGGSQGWEVLEDPLSGRVRLRYGQPRTLPGIVSMVDLLPAALDTSNWSRLPLGIDPTAREACVDLTNGPHTLVVGPTGSGKSVFLRQHAASALAHGHDLIVIDPIKSGLDFMSFRPWCLAFVDDGIEQARVAIEQVYAEGMRRKALQKRYAAPAWTDLPADVRARERIKPLTVLFDEFMSAVIASPVPKGLDKDDPLVEESNRINADKGVILAMVGKIARELRFTGIFLAIAMQRPDASLLQGFGEIRSNLSSAIQLVKPGSLPAQETLRMVFPGEQTQAAADTIMELDDGASKGLATIAAEGGDVTGFRVGFGVPSEIPDMLRAIGVPEATPWELDEPDEQPPPGQPIPSKPQPKPAAPTAAVTDLGEIALSLDDLTDFKDDGSVVEIDVPKSKSRWEA